MSGKNARGTSLKTVGLFAGIGGFEIGLAKAGHDLACMCENDRAARAVLQKHFSSVEVKEDISTMSGFPRGTELVVGGFPCQDLSQVGTTHGLRGKKSTLVSHVFRMLQQRRVPWLILENVPFMLHLHRGAAVRYITSELEALGYSWAYRTVDTRAFGLPQRRERVFLLAGIDEEPWKRLFAHDHGAAPLRKTSVPPCGFYWTEGNRGLGWAPNAIPTLKGGSALGIPSPPAIWLKDDSIVTLEIRDAERVQGFPANWTKPAEAVGRPSLRWRLVGNAVTTQVAEWLGALLANGSSGEPDGVRALREHDPWPAAAMGRSGTRFEVPVSKWPIKRGAKPIDDFLKFGSPLLSYKAANGFWQRLRVSGLKYPPEFANALKLHIKRVQP
jgi:DNA (cytosine-5)-methyltransferase 1